MPRPRIGITMDLADGKCAVSPAYGQAVWNAGGLPVLLPIVAEAAGELLDQCDGLLLTGGDDPIMEPFGIATHPKATKLHPDRQAFELALLHAATSRPSLPVLGVCLGMQLMALHSGGALDQYLPDTLKTHEDHYNRRTHTVHGELGAGLVHSHHRQAVTAAGNLEVVARAPDQVIEAVRDRVRNFYLGVQWHPERTADPAFSTALFQQLVQAAQEC